MIDAVDRALMAQAGGCSLCHGAGWVLEFNHVENPLVLELLPCLIPDCEFSGRSVKLISVGLLGHRVATWHPRDGYIMSLKEGGDANPNCPGLVKGHK